MFELTKLEKVLGKDLTEKLKAVFTTEKTEPSKFIKLADGSVELSGTIEVGQPITMKAADGSEVSAPDGEHALEGGKTITVMGGVITEIADTASEIEEDESEVMSAEKIQELIQNSLNAQAAEFKKVTDALNQTIAELKEANKESFKAVVESLELMADIKAPAPEPKADPKNAYAQKRAEAFQKFLTEKNKINNK
jgi:hypothetical protein